MIRADFHMHSSFSEDSTTLMEEQIIASINKGLNTICITEHLDYDFPDNPDNAIFLLDTEAYYSKYIELKDKYKDKIDIRFGVELGLQPHLGDKLLDYTSHYDFDFIIGSTHVCDGYDVYYKDYFEGKTDREAYERYFIKSLENIHSFSNFDTYGHLDYITRYGKNKDTDFSYISYADHIDAILNALISKGIGIEVNTGAFKSGLNHPNPDLDIVRRYKELGGEIITVGADAHSPEYVAAHFDKAEQIIKDAGFDYYTIFKNRTPHFIKF